MGNQITALVTVSLLLLTGLLASVSSGADRTGESGQVQIRIVGPDGKVLGHADVDLTSTQKHARFDEKLPHVAAQTDEKGIVRFQWPTGNAQINVNVKGKGYGTTGLVEVTAASTVDAPLPPLAPYATVSGTVPDGKDAEVTLSGVYFEEPVKVTADKDGRFAAEVHGGGWWVNARKGPTKIARSERMIVLVAGDAMHDLKLKPLTPKEQVASTQPHSFGRPEPQEKIASWAEGTVRDEVGNPIAGATIYAAAIFYGGIRMYETAAKATTDAAGHYAVKGQAGLSAFSATLVAHKVAMVPAAAWIALPEPSWVEIPAGATRPTTRAAAAPRNDFVLTTRGGKLDVVVLFDHKPAPGANVALFLEGGNLRNTWAAGAADAAQTEVEAIAYPRQKTGADGAAHFDFLPPGRYQAIASIEEETAKLVRQGFRTNRQGAYAIADAVAVRAGETTVHRLSVYAQPNAASIRAIRQDGQPLTGNVAIEWGHVSGGGGWNSSMKFDASGIGVKEFESPGLWHVAFRYRDSPVRYIPIPEPYYSAEAVLAASPRLAVKEPARTTAMRFDAGSVSVELCDADGKPARGIAEIGQPVGEPTMIGSTDEQGQIRFEHVPTRHYVVKGWIGIQRGPDLGMFGDVPLPPDAELTGRTFVPSEPLTLVPNKELHLRLQARPAGFVRGVLRPPPGNPSAQYAVYIETEDYDRGAQCDFLKSTGEFVAGPFPAGKTHLFVGSGLSRETGHEFRQEVAIEGRRVTIIEIKPPALGTRSEGGGNIMIGIGGQQAQGTGAESLSGHVYLADGKTPVYGAMLLYLVPGDWQPHLAAMTDVTGNIHGRSLWYTVTPQTKESPGSPTGPIIVAMAPGTRGAAIVDAANGLDKPFSIALPNPINLRGTVTLGGAKLAGQTGRFRILAAYQGKGKLNNVLSVWATPQEDGSFELAGLTPGTYQVQAALDDIWLSNSISVTAEDHPLAPIQLDIGDPGGPARIQCIDGDGKPMRGARITVDRPAGPLASLYWPSEFVTDGAGAAYIPALEAGKHTVRLEKEAVSREFTVQPLPADGPVIVKLQAESSRK